MILYNSQAGRIKQRILCCRKFIVIFGSSKLFIEQLLALAAECRLYVLQMRRNELKYGFNCQNHACFPRIYLQFFINKALTASNSVDRQNFVGKSVTETINLTEVFNITVDSR